jgi:hypothetical protein
MNGKIKGMAMPAITPPHYFASLSISLFFSPFPKPPASGQQLDPSLLSLSALSHFTPLLTCVCTPLVFVCVRKKWRKKCDRGCFGEMQHMGIMPSECRQALELLHALYLSLAPPLST